MRTGRLWWAAMLVLGLAAGPTSPAGAWQLTPEATATERGLAAYSASHLQRAINAGTFRGVAVVGNAVHEDITRRALRCPIGESRDVPWPPGCEIDIRYQEAGVRWNDDPAFKFLPGRGQYLGCRPGMTVRMVTQPACWVRVFQHGESAAAKGVRLTGRNGNLLVRSHFGDLQFLHAMAVADGEPPEQTRRAIMAWMEFTWRTSMGDAGFDARRTVARLPIDGFAERFRYNEGWRIQDLFALDNPGVRDADALGKLAFGSLVHVVEDSFAAGHVERAAPVSGATCAGAPTGRHRGSSASSTPTRVRTHASMGMPINPPRWLRTSRARVPTWWTRYACWPPCGAPGSRGTRRGPIWSACSRWSPTRARRHRAATICRIRARTLVNGAADAPGPSRGRTHR